MALSPTLSFEQSTDCTKLCVQEKTGIFDATDNAGGWGAPNAVLTDVSTATLKVLLPGKKTGEEIIVDLQPQLPSQTFEFKILKSQDFGLTADAKLPDGTYVMDYVLIKTDGTTIAEYHTEVTLFCTKGECVNDLMAKVAKDGGCDCEDKLVVDAALAFFSLSGAKSAAECQRPNEVTDFLTLLDRLCKSKDDCFAC